MAEAGGEGVEEKKVNAAQFSANEDTLIADFSGELNKDATTAGSFQQDYETLCSTFNIVPCPFIKISADKTSCKVINCAMDLSNWRAMLIAACMVNSEVKEFVFINCGLSKQHVVDLSIALEKFGIIHTLKMDYTAIVEPPLLPPPADGSEGGEERGVVPPVSKAEFWAPILSGKIHVPYVSLKGCMIDDECIEKSIAAISENVTVQVLNLSENIFTDIGASNLFSIIPLMSSIKHLILKQCQITGENSSLQSLGEIFVGKAISEEHNIIMKNVAKHVVELNKGLKDANKKRKGKYPDLHDLAAPTDRTIKVGEESLMVHRSLVSIDISYNDITTERFKDMVDLFSEKAEAMTSAGVAPCESKIIVLGMNDSIKAISAEYEQLEPEQQVNGKLMSVKPINLENSENVPAENVDGDTSSAE